MAASVAPVQSWLLEVGRIAHKGMDKLCLTREQYSLTYCTKTTRAGKSAGWWRYRAGAGKWFLCSGRFQPVRSANFTVCKPRAPPLPLTAFLSNLRMHSLSPSVFSSTPEQSPGRELFVENTLRQLRVAKFPGHSQPCPPRRVVSRAQTPPPVDLSLPRGRAATRIVPGSHAFPLQARQMALVSKATSVPSLPLPTVGASLG